MAACIREVSRRHDNVQHAAGSGGIDRLLQMFALPVDKDATSQLRMNALLFRGLMEFPLNVLAKSAQIRSGIWRRNGHAMADQVLNYAEPPFCRPLADADMLLLQFALICHTSQNAGGVPSIANKDDRVSGLAFSGQGTLRMVNLLLHRFGVFDFLGFEKAPDANVDRYKQELGMGLYPPEMEETKDEMEEEMEDDSTEEIVLPWTYCPVATDPATVLRLVDELLHLIIILITVSIITFQDVAFTVSFCLQYLLLLSFVFIGNAISKPS